MKLHAPPQTTGDGDADGLTLGCTEGVTLGSTEGGTLGGVLGGTLGGVLGGTLGGVVGGVVGGAVGLPPHPDENTWKDPQRLRLFDPPTQTSSTCPQLPAYAAAAP